MRRTAAAMLCVSVLLPAGPVVAAQCIDVAPGVCVSKRTYAAPVNEQPFFGFAVKTPAMIEADRKFVGAAVPVGADREHVAERAAHAGWDAVDSNDLATAGRRFNQAFLIDPRQSPVYHGFAVLAERRFNDPAYAEELFLTARGLSRPLPTLDADYARLLLILKRPREALPLLERAVKDVPTFSTAWSNLAFARFQTGDRAGACAVAAQAKQRAPSPAVQADLAILRRLANCD